MLILLLFSCEDNAICIDADDFGDIEREIIEVNSSDNYKCIVNPIYRSDNKYDFSSKVVNPILKECLTTTKYINEVNEDAQGLRELLGIESSNTKTCEYFIGNTSTSSSDILANSKDLLELCETFCENVCINNPGSTDKANWIANTPKKENSDYGVNITPTSKISITVEQGEINLPSSTSSPSISYSIEPHIMVPSRISDTSRNENIGLPIVETGQYDLLFSGEYFDNNLTSPNAQYSSSSKTYNFFSLSLNSDKLKFDSALGSTLLNNNQFIKDSLFFARRSIIYFEPADPISALTNGDSSLWQCLKTPSPQQNTINCDKGSDSYSGSSNVKTEDGVITKNGGFVRNNNFSSEPNEIVYSSSLVLSSSKDGFFNLKTENCNNVNINFTIANASNTYYSVNNLNISRIYTDKNFPFYKDSNINITFPRGSSCTVKIKTQKYLDITIPESGIANFQIKDINNYSYDDILTEIGLSYSEENFDCINTSPYFLKQLSFNYSSNKLAGIAGSCDSTTPISTSKAGGATQYLGSPSLLNTTSISNNSGFNKIQVILGNNFVKDLIFFKADDTAYRVSDNNIPSIDDINKCNSNPNCRELSCNGGLISGIKAKINDSNQIVNLSILCSGNTSTPSGLTPNNYLNSCTLYGRIINPSPTTVFHNTITIDELSSISKIISFDKISSSSEININTSTGLYLKKLYLGLQGYSDNSKKNLTTSECQIPLDNITNCKIGETSCNLSSSSGIKKAWLNNKCYNGDGLDGIQNNAKAGTGGGGGGNNSSIKYTYPKYGDDVKAPGGNNGESFINPEFLINDSDLNFYDYAENSNKGTTTLTNGNDGIIEYSTESSPIIYTSINSTTEQTLTNISGQIYYKIRGGAGGKGGNCNSNSGGNGANGDSFSGKITLPVGRYTIKMKVGKGGQAGIDCSNSNSIATNTDLINNLKGGNGGSNIEGIGGGGGAGGSASYISITRIDETLDNTREDFLVIAGGGGGGGGASSGFDGLDATARDNLDKFNTKKPNYELYSSAKGYRIGALFEPLGTISGDQNYYEYNDFFTKNLSDPTSNDPLAKINVFDKGIRSTEFFVRKGQVIRILPDSFKKFWNSKEGPKECGVGMLIDIKLRPALLCLSGISDSIPNPNCTPDFSSSTTSVASSGVSTDAPTSSGLTQTGCMVTTTCMENPLYYRPTGSSYNSEPSKAAIYSSTTSLPTKSYYCPNSECSKHCAEGTTSPGNNTDANHCTKNTASSCNISETYNTNSNPEPKIYSDLTCQNCINKKYNEFTQPPKIDILADENTKCYNFEEYNKSVHNFLNNYSSSRNKEDFIKEIPLVQNSTNFDSTNSFNFHNLEDFKIFASGDKFWLKQPISINNQGRFRGFFIANENFKNITSSYENIYGSINIELLKKLIYSKGQKLDIAICKENTLGECSGTELPIGRNRLLINNSSSDLSLFTFENINGSLKRISPTTASTSNVLQIFPCNNELVDENFFCFKGPAGESEDEIKKYRLSFKISDTDNESGNNSGSYKIKIEKREAPQSRAGGIVNGILAPLTLTLDGEINDDPSTSDFDERLGLAEKFYYKLISNPIYKRFLTLTIVMALSFYGMGYLIGINELKNSEILKILLKIGFIYLFTSTSFGLTWFNKYFIQLFKDAIDYITFSVADSFDPTNSNEIRIKIRDNNFYDKGVLFKSVDRVIDLLMSDAVQKKILALLFSSIFGWIYFLIVYYCLMTYIYAIANSMLLYITCQIMVSILFVLGPIFFIFLMFKVTKEMFDNWIKALIGFSLQQIFLITTLALFNIFVISFLKSSLGYRICWTNVLSLNLQISKISIFNFWTVAGTNSPESSVDESPEASFGSDENMPSLYSFLYLMIVVSLMKKFIELFTNLAITLAGGLKASTIGAEVANGGRAVFGSVSKLAKSAYQGSLGRVVANIDDKLFDSGIIAKNRKQIERNEFLSDMKTRASLNKAGNDAISKYKKENALKLAGMSSEEQKQELNNVKLNGMKKYASKNDISDKKLDKLINKTGLDYNGSNLFGMAFQTANQSVRSGGNLFTSIRDKNISTSFSKSEANSVIKKMPSDKREKFIESVKDGKIHVNKGKIENARSMAISAIKEPVKAILNPKNTAKKGISAISSAGKLAYEKTLKTNKIKNEAIEQLTNAGKISEINGITPNFIKNWARTDDEKKIIRDKMREISQEKGSDKSIKQITSKNVLKDLELTKKYAEKIDKSGYVDKKIAQVQRFGSRIVNQFNRDKLKDKNDKVVKNFSDLKLSESLSNLNNPEKIYELEKIKEKAQIEDSKLEKLAKDNHKKFNLLSKLNDDLKNNNKKVSEQFKNEINSMEDSQLKKQMLNHINVIENSRNWKEILAPNRKENYVNNLIKNEISENKELNDIIKKRDEFRVQIIEANSKINNLKDDKNDLTNFIEKALTINKENMKKYDNYKTQNIAKRAGKGIVSKILSNITLGLGSNAIGLKDKFNIFKERSDYNEAKNAIKKFNKLKTPKDIKKFVEQSEKKNKK